MRIGQVTSLIVRFEPVATMNAGLGLGLGLGLGRNSHAGQSTRRGLESVLFFHDNGEQRRRLLSPVNYLLSASNQSCWILALGQQAGEVTPRSEIDCSA